MMNAPRSSHTNYAVRLWEALIILGPGAYLQYALLNASHAYALSLSPKNLLQNPLKCFCCPSSLISLISTGVNLNVIALR
jgi:hypothetical protein